MSRLILCPALFLMLWPSAPARAELPPLIPRKVLFGNPVKASPEISPDGKRLAYLAPDQKDVLQVWVQTIGKADARRVTADKRRGIRIHFWTYAPDTLVYLQDNAGDENWHIYAVNLKTEKVRDLTPFKGVRVEVVGIDRNYPGELLAGLNRNNPRVLDVYRIQLSSGDMELDTKNPGDVVAWDTDPKFRVRVAQAATRDGGMEIRYRDSDKGKWKTAVTWGPEDAEGHVIGFTADGKSLWLETSQGRDTLSLVRHDLKTGQDKVVASDPHSDAGTVIFNPLSHTVEAVAFNRERVHWKALDPKVAEDLEVLAKGARGEPSVASRDLDLDKWVVSYSADVHPTDYYLYDRPSRKLTHLFSAQPALARYKLAPMKPVTIKSRDGLELVCYLTLPVGLEPRNLPTVLMVHGGPWARDMWGYSGFTQWLANRGYAVLSVNYRGSTGFGKKFLHAGDREWAGKMHDDLIDAVQWAVKKGYSDPRQVAIFGGSYGGYAALVGATFTPDAFACAVDIVGPSNLVTLLKSIPPYWAPMKRMFSIRIGDPEKDADFLRSRSPLFKADRIRIPMLIAQGANDPRVKQAEAEQIVGAIRKSGKPVEYMLFPDEGHGFARPENRLKFCAAAEAFLARYLRGGRAEPPPAKDDRK